MDSCSFDLAQDRFRRNDTGQSTCDRAQIHGDSFDLKLGGQCQKIQPYLVLRIAYIV